MPQQLHSEAESVGAMGPRGQLCVAVSLQPLLAPPSRSHGPRAGDIGTTPGSGAGRAAPAEAGGSLTAPLAPPAQRWGRAHRRLHHAQHRAGEDALRGGGGHVSDGEDLEDAAAGHGADRGECPSSPRCWEKGREPTSLDAARCPRVPISHATPLGALQDQYQLCYRAALEYLGSFDHYAT